ncbi:MAG: hypothetical protein R2865_05915 [Deinococcales bacterium]
MNFCPFLKNYYDDLEAKYNLNPELLARLKEHHILYDQHEDGYFSTPIATVLTSVFL